MKRILIFIALALLFYSCSHKTNEERAIQKIDKIKDKYPNIFTIKRDTVTVHYADTLIRNAIKYDTTIQTNSDTVFIDNTKLSTKIYVDRFNDVIKYRVISEIKNDTVIVERVKVQYITEDIGIDTTKKSKFFDTFSPFFFGFGLLIIFLLINIIRGSLSEDR